MDFVDGTDTAQLLHKRYPTGIPAVDVCEMVSAVAEAVDYAHGNGLLHRDVKPANVLTTQPNSGKRRILLADFGIARKTDDISGLTATNMTVGTVSYAAPEQLMGDTVDGRADQYALAGTAFHWITGAVPFEHSNPAVVISRHLNAPVPALAVARPDRASLDRILAAALAKNPDDRFACCTDFARALTETTAPQTPPIAAAPTTPAPAARRPPVMPTPSKTVGATGQSGSARSATWRLIGISIAAVLLLLGVIGVLWRPWQRPQSNTTAISPSNAPTTSIPTGTTTAAAPSVAASPPVTVTASAPAHNPARENNFMAALNAAPLYGPNHISYVAIPGSHDGAYMGDPAPWMPGGAVVEYGYKACAVLARYPNDHKRATDIFYQEQGFGAVDASMEQERMNYMEVVAADLC